MKTRYQLILCLLLLSLAGQAKETEINKRIQKLDIDINLFEQNNGELFIPLKRAGNLFYIEAKINDVEGNFLLDLGAPYLVLNATYFRDYDIDDTRISGTLLSDNDNARTTEIENLNIRGLEYKNLKADITDLAQIENSRSIKIFGLFGVDLFKEYILELDIRKRLLVLHQNRKLLDKQPANRIMLDTDIRLKNNTILVKAKSNNVKLTLCLDTAAEISILDNGLSPEAYEGMRVRKALSTVDANGGATEVLNTVLDRITIAEIPFKKMNTLVLNLKTMSRAYDHNIDGMLGYPFLARGWLIIDFKQKRL